MTGAEIKDVSALIELVCDARTYLRIASMACCALDREDADAMLKVIDLADSSTNQARVRLYELAGQQPPEGADQ